MKKPLFGLNRSDWSIDYWWATCKRCSSIVVMLFPIGYVHAVELDSLAGEWEIDFALSDTVGFGITPSELEWNDRTKGGRSIRPSPSQKPSRSEAETSREGVHVLDTSSKTQAVDNMLPIASVEKLVVEVSEDRVAMNFGDFKTVNMEFGKTTNGEEEIETKWRRDKLEVRTRQGRLRTKQIYQLNKSESRLTVDVEVYGLGQQFKRKFKRVFVRKKVPRILVEEL